MLLKTSRLARSLIAPP